MQYRHLFFDLDHTLWDFDTNSKEAMHEIFTELALPERGITDFEAFFEKYSFHNHRLWDKYSRGLIKQDELRWKRMFLALVDFKVADDALSKEMAVRFLDILPSKNGLFPYTHEILSYLKNKGYEMHLITNGFEKVQYQKLEKSNIGHYFNQVITSEIANSLKPQKEIFDFAIARSGANRSVSIMIGDNIDADIAGAQNAGLDTVFVNHLNVTAAIQPTYVVYCLKELEIIF